jgi:hypothetical protein
MPFEMRLDGFEQSGKFVVATRKRAREFGFHGTRSLAQA